MKVKDLQAADYNPRQITDKEQEMLSKSMKEFGDLSGIVFNKKTGQLIGGHQRITHLNPDWKIVKVNYKDKLGTVAHGYIETPHGKWVYREVDWPRKKEMLANVAANKHGGAFDMVKLKDLIVEIDDGSVDMELSGFEISELKDIFNYNPTDKKGLTDADAVPEKPKKAKSKLGDLFRLGKHRLLCGDATKKEDVDKLMNGEKADMVITDPPYNINYENIKHKKFKSRNIENDNMTGEQFGQFCSQFAESIEQITDNLVYVFGPPGPDGRIMFSVLDRLFHCSTTVVWNKDQFTLGRGKYQNKYEPCWFGWSKSGKNFTTDRTLTNVWDVPRPKSSKEHPTMKPIELCKIPILHGSNRLGIVCDIFLGSGSTLIACENTERVCYGMEIDPGYCDVIIKRWEDFTGEKAEKVINAGKKTKAKRT